MERKLLIVEDDCLLAEAVGDYFTGKGWKVEMAEDGLKALELLRRKSFHLLLLDVMLPEMDGFAVCREVRKSSDVPVIFITARVLEEDKLNGYSLGADDYVTKPFSTRELIARVKANLRRHYSQPSQTEDEETNEIVIKDITVYPDAYSIKKRGADIELTHREFELFHYLAKHIGQVMTREHLLQTVWGYDYFGDVRTVDVTIRRLREKIEDDASHPEYIVTRRGVGYFLQTQE